MTVIFNRKMSNLFDKIKTIVAFIVLNVVMAAILQAVTKTLYSVIKVI